VCIKNKPDQETLNLKEIEIAARDLSRLLVVPVGVRGKEHVEFPQRRQSARHGHHSEDCFYNCS